MSRNWRSIDSKKFNSIQLNTGYNTFPWIICRVANRRYCDDDIRILFLIVGAAAPRVCPPPTRLRWRIRILSNLWHGQTETSPSFYDSQALKQLSIQSTHNNRRTLAMRDSACYSNWPFNLIHYFRILGTATVLYLSLEFTVKLIEGELGARRFYNLQLKNPRHRVVNRSRRSPFALTRNNWMCRLVLLLLLPREESLRGSSYGNESYSLLMRAIMFHLAGLMALAMEVPGWGWAKQMHSKFTIDGTLIIAA